MRSVSSSITPQVNTERGSLPLKTMTNQSTGRTKVSMKQKRLSNTKQCKESDSNKRRLLKERHLQVKKEREKKAHDAKYQKDEEERQAYTKRKREEKMMQQKKKDSIEVAQKAWKLAILHHSLVVLRKYFLTNWTVYIQEKRLLWVKATMFWKMRTTSKCFSFLFNYTREKRIREERNQFENADQYHQYRMLESVLHHWNKLAIRSHYVLYDRVLKIRMHYNRSRLLSLWKTKLSLKRVLMIKLENKAVLLARHNNLSWIMRKFKAGVSESKREREEEEMIGMKWREIRGWLKDD